MKEFLKKLFVLYKMKRIFASSENKIPSTSFLSREEFSLWEKKFRGLGSGRPRRTTIAMVDEFFNSTCYVVSNPFKEIFDDNKPVLISVIKNDIDRVKYFLNYYRKMGVAKFCILDDRSTDGTKEYLLEQNDVKLYASDESFYTQRKEAWINRILLDNGYGRWYLVIDSDEILQFDQCNTKNINDLIKVLEERGTKAASGFMLDMYSENPLFSDREINKKDIYGEYCFYDKEGYDVQIEDGMKMIFGGMRKRIFNQKPLLTKTPIFYFDEETVYANCHSLYPFSRNVQNLEDILLLHYKFLPSDIEKYKERIKNKSMHNGSAEYQAYYDMYKENSSKSPLCEISHRFDSFENLLNDALIRKIPEFHKGNL